MRGCLAGLLLATLVVAAFGCGSAPEQEPGGLDPQSFDAFPLYAPGGDFADSLEVVRQRPGYIEFRYSSEPPLRVEVWPGCVRTPVLRPGVLIEGEAYGGTFLVRGATAYEFENGVRVEVPLDGATVVVRAQDRRDARRAVKALQGVNNSVERDDALPGVLPEEIEPGCSVFDPEAPLIAAQLREALGLQGQPAMLRCGRSLSIARMNGIDDAHDCFSGTPGGEASFWCVLSRGDVLAAGAMAFSCEEAQRVEAVARPLEGLGTLGWGVRAGKLCEPRFARVPEVIAGMDQERVMTDLSYVWEVMSSYEAELVADLRSVGVPSADAEEVLALYEARIEAIRAAVDHYHTGGRRKALADLQDIESRTPELVARLTALGARACAPPW
jgi:hypothetical protein